jgi:hypothetical protein
VPNQRDPEKARLRTWMHIKDIQALRAIAEREGLELGDFLAKIAKERNQIIENKNDKRGN